MAAKKTAGPIPTGAVPSTAACEEGKCCVSRSKMTTASSFSSLSDSWTIIVLQGVELWAYLSIKFLPKFILEVLGGAGAIWGFSEACGLRTPETEDFWRPASLTFGGLFLVRFCYQICLASKAKKKGNMKLVQELAMPIWDLEDPLEVELKLKNVPEVQHVLSSEDNDDVEDAPR